MSELEKRIYTLIPQGIELKITTRELASITNMNTRTIRDIINRLIKKHKVPICAIRTGHTDDRGLFIATNEEELELGTREFKQQIADMTARLNAIQQAKFNVEEGKHEGK